MRFFDLFKQKDAEKLELGKLPIKSSPVLIYAKANSLSNIPRRKHLANSEKYFEPSEYDLVESGRVEDVESLVMIGNLRKTGLMFKAGWSWTGKNPERIKYIKNRQLELEQAQGRTLISLFEQVGRDLIKVSNSFLVKARDIASSSGRVRTLGNKSLKPIAAYFHLMPETVQVLRDEGGKILAYRQKLPSGKFKDFNPDDVVHFTFNRKGGFFSGTPITIPVLDDIRALRRIEENVELLVYHHLFPLYHYKIGTDEHPPEVFEDGATEIDIARMRIQELPQEGAIVTPWTHEIEALGAQGKSLRVEGYIEHFKKRVIAGLGMSQIDYGDGQTANRSTADNMSGALIDLMKYYQMVMADQVQYHIVYELLFESTFDQSTILDDENIVHFRFNEIDTEYRLKIENHGALMYSMHSIGEDEMREDYFSRVPVTEADRDKMYFELIAKPLAELSAVEAPTSEETVTNKSATGSSKTVKQKKSEPGGKVKAMAKIRQQPTNQFGKNLGPTKAKSSDDSPQYSDDIQMILDSALDGFDLVVNEIIARLRQDPSNIDFVKQLSFMIRDRIKRQGSIELSQAIQKGVLSLESKDLDISRELEYVQRLFDRDVDRLFNTINRLLDSIVRKASLEERVSTAIAAFDTIRYRGRFIDRTRLQTAYNFGRAIALRSKGIKQGEFLKKDDCELCIGRKYDLEQWSSILPIHPNCTCLLIEESHE